MPHLSRYREGITQGQREDRMLRAFGQLGEQQHRKRSLDLREQEMGLDDEAESAAQEQWAKAMAIMEGGAPAAQQQSMPADVSVMGLPGAPPPTPPAGPQAAPAPRNPVVEMMQRASVARRAFRPGSKEQKAFDLQSRQQVDALEKQMKRQATADMLQGAAKDGIVDENEMRQYAQMADAGDYTGVRNAVNDKRNDMAAQADADENWQSHINMLKPLLDRASPKVRAEFGVSMQKAMGDSRFRLENNPSKWFSGALRAIADEDPVAIEQRQPFMHDPKMFSFGQGNPQANPAAQFQSIVEQIKRSPMTEEEKVAAFKAEAQKLGIPLDELRSALGG